MSPTTPRDSLPNEAYLDPASLYPPDYLEWIALTPEQRLARSAELWDMYLFYGGSLDADLDPQSPFFDPEAQPSVTADGRPGVRLIRRC